MSASVTPSVLREAASRFATGITIVCCVDAEGVDHAMTASSFVAVSLEPPLVSVCVERGSRFHGALARSEGWTVSVLAVQDEDAGRWFATRGRPLPDQLSHLQHHRGRLTGAAVADAALASLECRTWATYPGGDHDIVVGEVVATEIPADPGPPLLYYRRSFRDAGWGAP